MPAASPIDASAQAQPGILSYFAKSLDRSISLFCALFTAIIISCALFNYALIDEEKSTAIAKRAGEVRAAELCFELTSLQNKLQIELVRLQHLPLEMLAARGEERGKGGLNGAAASAREFKDNVTAAKKVAAAYADPQLFNAFQALEQGFAEFYEAAVDLARLYATQGVGSDDRLKKRFEAIGGELQKQLENANTALESAKKRDGDELADVNAQVDGLRNRAMSVAAAGVVLFSCACILAIFLIRKYVVQPLGWITFAFNKLAGGDPSCEVYETTRADEIGDLARAYADFRLTTLERGKLARESRLLGELSEWLQCCKSLDELYEMTAMFLTVLLPDCPGCLYIYANSRDVLDCVKGWNGAEPASSIHPDDCWSLRRGRTFTHGGNEIEFHCAHAAESTADYCCIPILAHSETMGMLHLEFRGEGAGKDAIADRRRLGMVCAEQISMAIANVKLRDQLRDQTIRDPLTGLFNRRYLLDMLRREFSRARRTNQSVCVLSLDVDHFKLFNDNHGHDAGDTVLRAVGECLEKSFRNEDTACRYGGEEFIVVMPAAPPDEAIRRAEELRAKIEAIALRYLDRNLPRITVSIGVAAFPSCGDNPEAVIRAADAALYQAKDSGRNRVEASVLLECRAQENDAALIELHAAVARKSFGSLETAA